MKNGSFGLIIFFVLLSAGALLTIYYCQHSDSKPISGLSVSEMQTIDTNVDLTVYGREYENRAEYQMAYGIRNEGMTKEIVIY